MADPQLNQRRGPAAVVWTVSAIAVWLICLPAAWVIVSALHVALTSAKEWPVRFNALLFSYLYAGWAPLIVALVSLWLLGHHITRHFRLVSIGISLLLGGWLGFYLVGIDEPAVQMVLLAWGIFGVLAPFLIHPGGAPPSPG
jgi:hypothetical protein